MIREMSPSRRKVADIELACRSAHEHANGAYKIGACRRMASEVDRALDGHQEYATAIGQISC